MILKCDIFHFSSSYAAISLFMIELNLLENILCKNEKIWKSKQKNIYVQRIIIVFKIKRARRLRMLILKKGDKNRKCIENLFFSCSQS